MPTIATDAPQIAADTGCGANGAAFPMHWPRRGRPMHGLPPRVDLPDPRAHREIAVTGIVLMALIAACSVFSNVWGH